MQEIELISSRADLEVGIAKIVGKCSSVKRWGEVAANLMVIKT